MDASPAPLKIVDDLDPASHDSEAGELPEHHEHAFMNRRLDEDLV